MSCPSPARWLLMLGLCWPLAGPAEEVEVLISNGPSSRRFDLAVLGDGYRAEDQAQLRRDAVAFVDGLFALTPFAQYRALFNVKLIHVVSAEIGADNGSYGAARDTTLGAAFNCYGIDRLLCIDANAVATIAAANAPEYDQLIVLVNDPKYGGSGGEVAVASLHEASAAVLSHELGHSIGDLADEYTSPYPAYGPCVTATRDDCPEPNATVHADPDGAKWAAWIAPGTPLPTPPGTTGVGVFEGCRYETRGVYRPTDDSCMMNSLVPAYCEVCTEGLVLSFWRHADPIDDVSSGDPAPSPCEATTLSVTTPSIASIEAPTWTVDGRPAGSGATFALPTLGPGAHEIAVTVHDGTALVRDDPFRLLDARHVWTLSAPCLGDAGATDAGAPQPRADAGTDAGGRDGGSAGDADAGVVPTDGGRAGPLEGGCGCAVSPPPMLTIGLALLWLDRRARRRATGTKAPRPVAGD